MKSKAIKKRPVAGKSRAKSKIYAHHKIAASRRRAIDAPCNWRRKYYFGTPLKSLAKTQVALFGVVFISTILLSSILTFAQTNESINDTVQQIVETLTGDNSSDNSSEASTEVIADIVLPADNTTAQENSTSAGNTTNETVQEINDTQTNEIPENATNETPE